MRFFLLISILFACFSVPTYAYYQLPFPDQLIGQQYQVETRDKKSNQLLGTSKIKISQLGKYIVIDGQATGNYNGQKIDSRVTRYFTIDSGLATIYYISGEVSKNNEPWQRYTNQFDWTNMMVAIDYLDREKNQRKTKNLPITKNLITVQDLDLFAASLPARDLRSDNIKIIVPDGTTFGMMVKQAKEQFKPLKTYRLIYPIPGPAALTLS